MNKLVFDSSAWIEYLTGTQKGMKVRAFLAGATIFITGAIASEVLVRIARVGASVEDAKGAFSLMCAWVPFDVSLAGDTAVAYVEQRKEKPKFSLVDAHVLAIAQQNKAKVVTCDNDFAGLPGVVVVR